MIQMLCTYCNQIAEFEKVGVWRDWTIIQCQSCYDEVMIGHDEWEEFEEEAC